METLVVFLLPLFIPLESGSGSVIGTMFGQSHNTMWLAVGAPIILWVILLLLCALFSASYLIPKVDPKRAGDWLSVAGRFLLYDFPIALLLQAAFGSGFRSQGACIRE